MYKGQAETPNISPAMELGFYLTDEWNKTSRMALLLHGYYT